MDTTQFITALFAIVVIDIVLAGDNAIVIALAARALPPHLRKRAIVWGAVGAVAVRSLMTVIVVWLLKVPGLLVVGGVALVWIAYRLLLPDADKGESHGPAATTFWGAMRTIVIADAVMGLDNVLAVAGAAHGSYLLVVAGLVISVPIVVWGSTIVLKLVDRFPGVVYFGAAVLLWTAVRMIDSEPLLREWLEGAPVLAALSYLIIPLVLWIGFLQNHRQLESRIHARLAAFKLQAPLGDSRVVGSVPPPVDDEAIAHASGRRMDMSRSEGGLPMLKVLVPVDGSPNALRAVRHAIDEYRRHHELELHLLNVQPRFSRHISRFVGRQDLEAWHRERADAALAPARDLLAQSDVPHHLHQAVGDRAREICRAAERLGVHHIVMGTARKNSITRMLEDSATNKVLEATPVPVELVSGDAISKWERWGLPAGVVGAGSLLVLAID
jgi:YjbE family integral membrane protein